MVSPSQDVWVLGLLLPKLVLLGANPLLHVRGIDVCGQFLVWGEPLFVVEIQRLLFRANTLGIMVQRVLWGICWQNLVLLLRFQLWVPVEVLFIGVFTHVSLGKRQLNVTDPRLLLVDPVSWVTSGQNAQRILLHKIVFLWVSISNIVESFFARWSIL